MERGDHFNRAERLAESEATAEMAQVHATLAVAEELARVTEALDKLTQLQQDHG
jgi:hypothetical protein